MILASPSPLSVALGLAAATAYAVMALAGSRLGVSGNRAALSAAWFLHLASLVLALAHAAPHFGWAPALSMTAWLVLTVYALENRLYPDLKARRVLAALGALAVLLAVVFPGSALHVSASPWLPLHLALGLASYGLFGAAAVHAWLMTRAEAQMRAAQQPAHGVPLLTLERLTFRFVGAGFILLSATLLAGLLFGHNLAWKWDHKNVLSVLAWVSFAVLLVGRSHFGWRGRTARRVLYAGTAFLLLAYVGSRFVLEVLLGRTH